MKSNNFLILMLLPSFCFSLTIEEAYQYSRSGSESLSAKKASTLAQEATIYTAMGAILPSPIYSFDHTQKIEPRNNGSQQVTVSGKIIDFHAWASLHLQEEKNKLTRLEFEKFEQSFALGLIKAYLDILRVEKSLQAAIKNEKAIAQMVTELSNKFDAGLIARVDLVEAQAQYDESYSKVYTAWTNYELAQIKMREYFPQKFDKIADIDKKIALEDLFLAFKDSENDLQSPPALKAGEQQLQVAEVEKKRLGYSFLPKIHYSYTYYFDDGLPVRSHSLHWEPINFSNIAADTSLKYQYQSALHQKKYTYVRHDVETKSLEMTISTLLKKLQAQVHILHSTEEKLKTIKASFEAGTRTTSEVLEAQSVAINAQKDLFLLKYETLEKLFDYAQHRGFSDERIISMMNTQLGVPEPILTSLDFS